MAIDRIRPGTEIDGFTVGAVLHQGGMAVVFKVSRPDVSFPIVMKVPLILEGDNPAMIVGFEVEQMILPALNGPHAPRFVAAGDFTHHKPYLVMERIVGRSLQELFATAPRPPEEVAAVGADIAMALCDLHGQKVIHLDLKPGNVIRRETGEMAFIDFGLSRHLRFPDLLAEEFRVPFGTAPYIAPEQVQGVRTDRRSDLFALGVMLYELSTGELPFGDPKGVRGLRRRLREEPMPPRAIRPDTPPWLQEIVLRLLDPDPRQRYQRAPQVAFDLRHPAQVPLGARAARDAPGLLRRLWRRWRPSAPSLSFEAPADLISDAPIILVCVDLSSDMEELSGALRDAALRLAAMEADARIVCVAVLKTNRIALDMMLDDAGRSLHVQKLVDLRQWSAPLASLGPERISHHVLEDPDPADAIVAFAAANRIDHILVGARSNSPLRRHLGSVSAQVVAEAPCSVTVIRRPSARLARSRAREKSALPPDAVLR